MKRASLLVICLIGLSAGLPAWAQPAASQEAEVATLKQEVQELREQLQEERRTHEADMKEVRQQLAELAATRNAVATSQPAATPPSPGDDLAAAVQQAQAAAAPSAAGTPASGPSNWLEAAKQSAPIQSFNPDISLVGDFQGRHDSNKGGVLSDKRIVKELELGISGNIDPYVRFDSVFSVHPKEDEDTGYDIDVEEAYISPLSTALRAWTASSASSASDFGKVNELHQHALPWPEYPLVIQKFFGEEGLGGRGRQRFLAGPGRQVSSS